MTQLIADNAPPPPDQAEWDKAATTFLLEQYKRVQDRAEKWSGAVTALLGVLGTVAVAAGTEKISDISDATARLAALGLTILGGALAAAAIGLTAVAANGPLSSGTKISNFNGAAYRGWVNASAQSAGRQLKWGVRFGIAAAACAFIIGVITLMNAASPAVSSGSSVLVVDGDGNLHCGALVTDDTKVTLDGDTVAAAHVIAIENCGSAP